MTSITRVASALAVCCALAVLVPPAQAQSAIFRQTSLAALPDRNASGALETPLPRQYRAYAVDVAALETALAAAPLEGARSAPVEFSIPFPDGTMRRFAVVESPVMAAELQAKFPEIRTYVGQGIENRSDTVRLSVSPMGFHAMVLSASGTMYVDPHRRWDKGAVLAYWKRDAQRRPGDKFHCEVEELLGEHSDSAAPSHERIDAASGTQLRTYRLALAGTAEYTTAVCNPNPAAVSCGLAAMVVSMNRVNGVYEREVAIRMVMVANNNLVVYTANPDPYTNGNGGTMLGQNQTNLDTVIGSANYDIGHVFSTGGGGVAFLEVPCTGSKAGGVTGRTSPVGDAFDIDYVAHEMGHQWGGDHTFNGTTSSCGGGNREPTAAYEPGSGSTIQAYAGICAGENLQPNSDDTFHTKSFDQIVNYSVSGDGNDCAVITATGNTPPTVNAGAAYTIPKQTPFTLTGSATDPDPDSLTYMWEEFDLGSSTTSATIGAGDTSAIRPIFRSFVPLTIPSRTFPKLSDILNNVTTIGEYMSNRARTMTFRLTARDNRASGGGVNYASTTVTVNTAAGPFQVTQPNTALSWMGGTSQTITWNVASTTAAPVSCANVLVELSTDGGNNFTAVLSASTPNDGTELLPIPNTPSATARVKVSCVGNIFFDISNTNFTITPNSGGAPPDLTAVNPTSGSTLGSTVVALTGTDFVNGATVSFGGTPATGVTFNSSTSLTATTPAHVAGLVGVTVINPDTQSDTLPSSYTFVAPPDLVSVLPTSGPTAGGTVVALSGTGFVNGATVTFDGTPATLVSFNSSTSISATSPAHAAGAVAVAVTNPDTQSDSLAAAYTYTAPTGGFYTLGSCRAIDTRNLPGPTGGPALQNGVTRSFQLTGVCGVPANAKAVAVNATVVSPTGAGQINFLPAGSAVPSPPTSVISFVAAQTRANNAVIGLSVGGAFDALPAVNGGQSVDLLIDVVGYFD